MHTTTEKWNECSQPQGSAVVDTQKAVTAHGTSYGLLIVRTWGLAKPVCTREGEVPDLSHPILARKDILLVPVKANDKHKFSKNEDKHKFSQNEDIKYHAVKLNERTSSGWTHRLYHLFSLART